jgi:AraC-like DNA-binding protein
LPRTTFPPSDRQTATAQAFARAGSSTSAVITAGTAVYRSQDLEQTLGARSIAWAFPIQHEFLTNPSPDFEAWVGSFEPVLLDRACSSPNYSILRERAPSGVFFKQLTKASARRLVSRFEELLISDHDTDQFNAGLGYLVLSAWAEHRQTMRIYEKADLHPAVAKAARLLRAESVANTLEQLAATCGASAAWLSRLFRLQMGVSLVEYRNEYRMERFFDLYRDGYEKNITQAAFEAGFGSYAQFHRVFRKRVGYAPAELRRRSR